LKKYIAEGFGTAMLTLIACGVAVVSGGSLVATSLAFGLVLMTMIYVIGDISGCHINPAVSLGVFMAGKMKAKDFGLYIAAQFIGALVGSLVLALFVKGFDTLGANAFLWEDWYIALFVELILTFLFVTIILKVTESKENKNVQGIIIGLALTLVHLFGIGFTGTSVNPARSFAPALFGGWDTIQQVWLFLLAPMGGAALAALFYKYVLKK
jgi:aquaporin Z